MACKTQAPSITGTFDKTVNVCQANFLNVQITSEQVSLNIIEVNFISKVVP